MKKVDITKCTKDKQEKKKKEFTLSIYHVATLYMILWLSKHAYHL